MRGLFYWLKMNNILIIKMSTNSIDDLCSMINGIHVSSKTKPESDSSESELDQNKKKQLEIEMENKKKQLEIERENKKKQLEIARENKKKQMEIAKENKKKQLKIERERKQRVKEHEYNCMLQVRQDEKIRKQNRMQLIYIQDAFDKLHPPTDNIILGDWCYDNGM